MKIAEAEEDVAARRPASQRGTAAIYELVREDIVEGRLPAGTRLKVTELAQRYGTSTNPVREALQQLRGEGFVLFTRNRGARVRPIDDEFVRDVYEITALIEPYMTRWFATYVTDEGIEQLEAIQAEIETTGFDDPEAYSRLDERFHRTVYDGHYNRHALDLWVHHREIMRALGRHVPFSRARRQAILAEHREMIECVKRQDADAAARVVARHVEGSGRHLVEQMRSARARRERAMADE